MAPGPEMAAEVVDVPLDTAADRRIEILVDVQDAHQPVISL
jgi:hypothetical protein